MHRIIPVLFGISLLISTSGFKVKGMESMKPYSKETGLSNCKTDSGGMKCYGTGTIAGFKADIEAYYWPNASGEYLLAGVHFDIKSWHWNDLIDILQKKYGTGRPPKVSDWEWEIEHDVIEAYRQHTNGNMWLHYYDKRKYELQSERKIQLRKEALEDF